MGVAFVPYAYRHADSCAYLQRDDLDFLTTPELNGTPMTKRLSPTQRLRCFRCGAKPNPNLRVIRRRPFQPGLLKNSCTSFRYISLNWRFRTSLPLVGDPA
jgi:hypothetical protein